MKTSKSSYCRMHDSQVDRSELIAFCGLGLAALALITVAVTDAAHFAQNREAIIEAWSGSGAHRVEFAQPALDQTPTDFPHVHATTAWRHFDSPSAAAASTERAAPVRQWQIGTDGAVPIWDLSACQR